MNIVEGAGQLTGHFNKLEHELTTLRQQLSSLSDRYDQLLEDMRWIYPVRSRHPDSGRRADAIIFENLCCQALEHQQVPVTLQFILDYIDERKPDLIPISIIDRKSYLLRQIRGLMDGACPRIQEVKDSRIKTYRLNRNGWTHNHDL